MRIGELARRSGASTRSLRYYERQRLLSARRDPNGYRAYDETEMQIVAEIRARLASGFSLEETRPFVECLRAGNAAGDACPEPLAVYRRKLAELDDCIGRLQDIRAEVAAQLIRAGAGSCRSPCSSPSRTPDRPQPIAGTTT